MREIQVETMCDACSHCELFELAHHNYWADDVKYETKYYCIHVSLCKNAIEIMREQNESNISD